VIDPTNKHSVCRHETKTTGITREAQGIVINAYNALISAMAAKLQMVRWHSPLLLRARHGAMAARRWRFVSILSENQRPGLALINNTFTFLASYSTKNRGRLGHRFNSRIFARAPLLSCPLQRATEGESGCRAERNH